LRADQRVELNVTRLAGARNLQRHGGIGLRQALRERIQIGNWLAIEGRDDVALPEPRVVSRSSRKDALHRNLIRVRVVNDHSVLIERIVVDNSLRQSRRL